MTDARSHVLRRIRDALADVQPGEDAAGIVVPRDYQRESSATAAAAVDLFARRVEDYRAGVRRLTEAGLADAVRDACVSRSVRRLLVPADLPAAWLARLREGTGVEILVDSELPNHVLDGTDGVLTGCALAIADTGTIVLDGGEAQGRRAITLVPDYHLCVVRAEQVVSLVPEAMARLEPLVRETRRPVTFISGPSATSDIELTRVEGVHGPRTLEVLLVAGGV